MAQRNCTGNAHAHSTCPGNFFPQKSKSVKQQNTCQAKFIIKVFH